MQETKPMHPDDIAMFALEGAYESLKSHKPTQRSELARRYQVAITEFEKVLSYFDTYVVRRNYWPRDLPRED